MTTIEMYIKECVCVCVCDEKKNNSVKLLPSSNKYYILFCQLAKPFSPVHLKCLVGFIFWIEIGMFEHD